MTKKIAFLTGTRADYGKIKSLISLSQQSKDFDVNIFATGMHLLSQYGLTINEIYKDKFDNVYPFINQNLNDGMDSVLAKTILGFSDYIKEHRPDLIFVHGDRVEALAGAIVGATNNIMVAHIEGGEVSGTIDESIRHAVSKLAHFHFVANEEAKNRLRRMGESEDSIRVVGSPDIDIMLSNTLPSIEDSLAKYELNFDQYALAIYHPVTTELDNIDSEITSFFDALSASQLNYIGIYPNNDHGSSTIIKAIEKYQSEKIRFFPSIRFENFLSLLKHASFIIGNSSAGIREAPVYGVPTVNIGSRQNNRAIADSIINCQNDTDSVTQAIEAAQNQTRSTDKAADLSFGEGNSAEQIIATISEEAFWSQSIQKNFAND